MNKFINKLPIEVIYIIQSYTYQFQLLELRKDIISYHESKPIIVDIFYKRYNRNGDTKSHFKHLLFHIHAFLTGIPNLYTNCEHKLYNVCRRNYVLKNKNNDYIKLLHYLFFINYLVDVRFNIYWALLTIKERNEFIHLHINNNIF